MKIEPCTLICTTILHICFGASMPSVSAQNSKPPVTLAEESGSFTLSNGFVVAKIEKQSGSVTSLRFNGLELLGMGQGRSNGYWSLPGSSLEFGTKRVIAVIADPSTNGGDRAIVSCRSLYDVTYDDFRVWELAPK